MLEPQKQKSEDIFEKGRHHGQGSIVSTDSAKAKLWQYVWRRRFLSLFPITVTKIFYLYLLTYLSEYHELSTSP